MEIGIGTPLHFQTGLQSCSSHIGRAVTQDTVPDRYTALLRAERLVWQGR